MKLTLAWLKEHLDTDATLDAITFALTDLGLEVETVSDPLAALRGFSIGYVEAAEQHPDADKLRVCRVATDQGERQIICGAPNARAGISVVVAQPGTYVPGIDTTIQVGRIRGVESQGMMCSEREMQLSDEHEGIIELPDNPPVGMAFADWLAQNDPDRADPVIEVKVTPNRPDALGIRGIARDLAARGLGRLIPRDVQPVAGTFPCPIGVTIVPELRDRFCPLFAGRVIRGVRNGPSPRWLQERLRAIGLRPISALVDVTNFFTHDRNRPLHVFDAGKVRGDLLVRMARDGESLAGLDDRTHALRPGIMVIADDAGVASIGGIMGGAATGCTEATVDVFVESALWDTITIAAAGRALKINSDARYRNERGIDPDWTLPGLEAATRMILDLCGGAASEVVVAGAVPDSDRAYPLDTGRLASLVGLEIAPQAQRATLEALGFRLHGDQAHPPSWRPDVLGSADLIEEIARVASLSGLEGRPLPRAQPGVSAPVLTLVQRREQIGRRTAAALGYNECVTYTFIDRAAAALFDGGGEAVRVDNPISAEMSHLRPGPVAGPAARGGAEPGARLRRSGAGRSRAGVFGRGAGRAAAGAGGPADRTAGGTRSVRFGARRRCPRCAGGCRGGAGGDGRAGQNAGAAGRRGLVASGPARSVVPGAEGAGDLRRGASAGAGGAGRQGAGGGLCRLARGGARAAQGGDDAAGAGAGGASGGRARLCLCRWRRGRGAGAGRGRRRGRQGADRDGAGVRRLRRRQGGGATGTGPKIGGPDRAVAADGPDPDRGRDRGGRGAGG